MGSAQVQGALWGARAGEFAELLEPVAVPLYEAAFEAIGITTGTRLLDVGCGAGLALQLGYERGAAVSGLDASVELLAVARSRLDEADLRQGELEQLPYDDDAFDVVTAFNSVQYATDPVQGLREIKRVAAPGAAVAVATWGPAEACEARHLVAAMMALLPQAHGGGGPFALSSPGALEAFVETARLSAQRVLDVATPFEFADVETAVRANLSPGPARAAVGQAGEERLAEALRAVLVHYQRHDGSVRLDNVFRVVIARA